mmetsp:Transcript_28724/g.69148  ORF Transcript_28724/g.69148 Transcript_28724/m.69148 type:complete len:124 (+) Transcript_28724:58-429(+)
MPSSRSSSSLATLLAPLWMISALSTLVILSKMTSQSPPPPASSIVTTTTAAAGSSPSVAAERTELDYLTGNGMPPRETTMAMQATPTALVQDSDRTSTSDLIYLTMPRIVGMSYVRERIEEEE